MIKMCLADICSLNMGQSPNSSSYNTTGEGIPFYQGNADFGKVSPKTTTWCTEPKKIAEPGDILLSVRAPIGAINIANEKCCIGRGLVAISPASENIRASYIKQALLASRKSLEFLGSGSTFKAIGKKSLGEFLIPVYSLPMQIEIENRFSQVSICIELLRDVLKKLDELVKSRFVEMFGNADSSSANFNISTINEICSSIVRGPFGSALKKEFFIPRGVGTYKVYEQKHAIRKRADIGIYYISKEKFDSLKRFECKPGDILMSCSGTMGELYQLPMNCEPGIINQALCKFTLNEKILPEYFFRFMSQVVDDLGAKGSGIKNVSSVKYIKDIKIPLPPLSLQQDFADFVHQVDKLKFDFDFLVSFSIPSICLFCLKLDP